MIRCFHDKVQFSIPVGFHVGFSMFQLQAKARDIQRLAASDGSRRTDIQRGLCQRGFVLLGSMLVSSFQDLGEVTLQKGTVGVHVGLHVGFHAGFQLPGYGRGHHAKRYRGGPCWAPCRVPSWKPAGEVTMQKGTVGVHFPAFRVWERSGSMLGSMLVSGFQGMGEVTTQKASGGFHVVFHVGLVSSFQGMGECKMGVHVGFHVGFQLSRSWGSMLGSMLGRLLAGGVHVGLHVGFQLAGYGRGHLGKGTVGFHVVFHVGTRGKVCVFPLIGCFFPLCQRSESAVWRGSWNTWQTPAWHN